MDVAVIDLGYGDAGKGAVTDRLASTGDYAAVVRFSGGCQAAHNVITDDGRHHTFAQFGSATFQGLPTLLSRFMLVEPLSLAVEARHLETLGVVDPLSLVHLDSRALLTTPYHWYLNRYQEDARGDGRHGSCGRGIGTTAQFALLDQDAPRVGDLLDPDVLDHKLRHLADWCAQQSNGQMTEVDHEKVMADYLALVPSLDIVDNALSVLDGQLIFEGSQGVLLDEDYGFHPHTTWSHTTARNARVLAEEIGHDLKVLGVSRAYSSRHGAGPFVSEDNDLDLPEAHNGTGRYQGGWRVGHLDVVALRHAVAVTKPDALYLTHLDALAHEPRVQAATSYLVDGKVWKSIPVLDPEDFDARARQTEALMRATAALTPFRIETAHEEMFGLDLAGTASGPRTSDGDIPYLG